MRKAGTILTVYIISTFLLSGCASKPVRKEMIKPAQVSIAQVRVVTQCVPGPVVRVRHSGGNIAATILKHSQSLIGVVAEPFAKMSAEKWQAAVEKDISLANIPRFHEIVMQKLIEKLGRKIPEWNPVITDYEGISPESVKSLLRDPEPLIVLVTRTSYSSDFHSCAPGLSTGHGLESRYYIRLYVKGKLVLEKSFKYQSDNEEGHYKKIEDFSANNWQLLKEEMDFAAKTIAERLIDDLMREIRRAD
jgi:hypothetical protein